MTTIHPNTEPAALRKAAHDLLIRRRDLRAMGHAEGARDAQRTARQFVRKAREIEKAQHAAAERRLTEMQDGAA